MKKLVVCLLAMLMLAGCSSNIQNTTTETTAPETTSAAQTAVTTVEVNDEMYTTFVDSYYSGEHMTDYTSSNNPYVFSDAEEANMALISAHLGCDEITEDETVLKAIQDYQAEQVAAFEALLRSFAPTLDESASYDNAKTIIMLKDAAKDLMYINSDGYVKIVMGDARATFKLSDEELNSLVTFLSDNAAFYETMEVCQVTVE